uniref:EF-hand domain-containing protein n=1 Tax=Entamoeba invadens TaxID=33085 RepID=S0AXG6_ENTIV|nr:hypothetical protein, conserved [Entamoeba invadens]
MYPYQQGYGGYPNPYTQMQQPMNPYLQQQQQPKPQCFGPPGGPQGVPQSTTLNPPGSTYTPYGQPQMTQSTYTAPPQMQQSTYAAPQMQQPQQQPMSQSTYARPQQYQQPQQQPQQYQMQPQQQPMEQVNLFQLNPPQIPAWEVSPQKPMIQPSPQLLQKWYYPLIKSIKLEQYNKIFSWFNLVDQDRSGTLEIDELGKATYPGNIRVSPQTALRFMRIFDTQRTGHLGLYEFIGLYRFLEICFVVFNTNPGNGPETLKQRLVAMGFNPNNCTTAILFKTFSYNQVIDLNNWVGCAAFVLQSRAIYQDMSSEGMFKMGENSQDASKVLDYVSLVIDK